MTVFDLSPPDPAEYWALINISGFAPSIKERDRLRGEVSEPTCAELVSF